MVGLLTLDSRMYNYGGFLQEMALQDAIKSLGYECEIIDYDVSQEFNTFSLKRGIKNFSFEKIKKKLIKEKTIPLSDYVSDLVEKRKNVFDEYRADNLVLSRKMSSSRFIKCEGWYAYWMLRFVLTAFISYIIVHIAQMVLKIHKKLLRYIGFV